MNRKLRRDWADSNSLSPPASQDPVAATEARKHFAAGMKELQELPPSYQSLYISQMVAQLQKTMEEMET